MVYSNIGVSFHDTVPLKSLCTILTRETLVFFGTRVYYNFYIIYGIFLVHEFQGPLVLGGSVGEGE